MASDGFLDFYGRGVVTLVLAAVIAASLAWRPFTEQYARGSVAKEYWDSPKFHAVNRRITAAWAGTVAVMGVGHRVSGALTVNAGAYPAVVIPANVLLNWVIPGALVYLTVRYGQSVAQSARPQAVR